MNSSMREKILEKLLAFLSEMPDEESGEKMPEMGEKPEAKLEVMSIEAEPKEKLDLKGL